MRWNVKRLLGWEWCYWSLVMWSVSQPLPDSAQGQPSPRCELWGAGMVTPVCPPHMAVVLGHWADTDTLGAMVSLPQSPPTMMAPFVASLSAVMMFFTSTLSTAMATNILGDNLCGLSSSPRSFPTCIVSPGSQIPPPMMCHLWVTGSSSGWTQKESPEVWSCFNKVIFEGEEIIRFLFDYPQLFQDIQNFQDIQDFQLCDIGRFPKALEYP